MSASVVAVELSWLAGLGGEALVVREGASCRTADQLTTTFIQDSVDVLRSLFDRVSEDDRDSFLADVYGALRGRSLHAEEHLWETDGARLTPAGFKDFLDTVENWRQEMDNEIGDDPFSNWFPRVENGELANQDMADPDELREDMDNVLWAIGLMAEWDDGFLILVQPEEDGDL